MSRELSTIRVTRRYGVAPQRVFDAWLDPVAARQWLFATATRPIAQVAIDARVAGSFRFVDRQDGEAVEYAGEYLEIVPPRRLVFTLSGESRRKNATRVIVEVIPVERGSRVRVIHEKVPPEHVRRTEGRWTGILYGLGVTLAAMPKPRIAGK